MKWQIPPVPTKRSTRSFQPLFLSKRMDFMEKYLNKLLISPELRQSKFVEGFLVMVNDDQFAKLKKDGDKIIRQTKLSNMITYNGEAQCVINQEVNQYLKKSNDYIGNQEIIYKKVRKLCNQLIIDFDQLSTTLFSLGDCFSQSYNLSLHFNSSVKEKVLSIEKNHYLEELYIHMNNMSISWGNNLTAQIKLVQDNMSNWFKYYDNELLSLKEHILKHAYFIKYLKIKEQAEKDFLSSKQKLTQKKDKLFTLGDTTKWEISASQLNKIAKEDLKNKELMFSYMLPKETIAEGELRDIYGFYNYASYQEIKRIMNNKIHDYAIHFNKFGQLQSDQITEMHVQWADLMTNMQCLGIGEKETTLLESVKQIHHPQSNQENHLGEDD